MLRVWVVLLAGVLAMASTGALPAETVQTLPDPTDYVNDFAGVLSPETLQKLSDYISRLDTLTHAQIAVVTIKTIDPDKSGATPSIEEFATALEDKWKVGKKGTDRGILMVLVMNPRRGRIEVGYGLEGILNDARVGDIGRDMAPYAQQGDYNQAVTLGVQELADVIAKDAGVSLETDPNEDPGVHTYHRESTHIPWFWKLVIGGAVLLVFLILCVTGHVGMAFYFLFEMIGMARGGDGDEGGGDGGGFGGFGGGSSGGGGASGDF